MPGYIIHLAVGNEYIKNHPTEILDKDKFIDGVIYPDLTNDKSKTHYGPKSSRANLSLLVLRAFLVYKMIACSDLTNFDVSDVNIWTWQIFLQDHLGIGRDICTMESYNDIMNSEEYISMSIYPNEGCIKIINGTAVVKLNY